MQTRYLLIQFFSLFFVINFIPELLSCFFAVVIGAQKNFYNFIPALGTRKINEPAGYCHSSRENRLRAYSKQFHFSHNNAGLNDPLGVGFYSFAPLHVDNFKAHQV